MADALLVFHRTGAQLVGVDGRLAREAEAALDAAHVRVVGHLPWRPCCHPFGVWTGVRVARFVLDATAGTVSTAVLQNKPMQTRLKAVRLDDYVQGWKE